MARRLAAALTLAALWCAVAPAQALQRLTVERFTLRADASPRVGVPFHLIVGLRVRERVTEIDNLELPMLAALELLGDEREIESGARGTQYREVITVVAHAPGALTIAPATLQAVDARDGRPKQWFSNALRIDAAANPAQLIRSGAVALWAGALLLLRLLLVLVAAAAVALGILLLLRRRRPPPVAVEAPPAPPRTRADRIADAVLVLRAARSRTEAAAVRAAVWRTLGASEGATLGDLLRRPDLREPATREMLVALERSTFTHEADLAAAIADACAALERYAERLR